MCMENPSMDPLIMTFDPKILHLMFCQSTFYFVMENDFHFEALKYGCSLRKVRAGLLYLQDMIGTVVDGGIGPNTLKALENYINEHGLDNTIEKYQRNRQGYYESLSHFDTFGRGWTRRVEETTNDAYKMSIPI